VTRKELVFSYTIGDRTWELDWFDLTIDDCAELTKVTGYRYPVLAFEHDRGDALAVKALLWMARRKAGEPDLAFTDPTMNFAMRDFERRKVRDTSEEEAAESGAADPQQPPAPEPAPPAKQQKPTRSTSSSKRTS
jgi:hypothetical protein